MCFTIPEAAEALGRTQLTLKRWIRDGILPPPIYKDSTYGYMHYSVGELQTVAKILASHERVYDYLRREHEETINRLWQAVEGHRKSNW